MSIGISIPLPAYLVDVGAMARTAEQLLLAKEVSTLGLFSAGRFLFGVGGGWLREEMELLGGDYDHRWTQTRESILATKELWTKPEAEFHGKCGSWPGATAGSRWA